MIDKKELLAALSDPEIVQMLHQMSDLDRSVNGQHHSLGKETNQAAPGPHNHDGGSSLVALLKDNSDRRAVMWATAGVVRYRRSTQTTITTDANGEATINHGLPVTPISVIGNTTPTTAPRICQTGSFGPTTFTVRLFNTDNTRAASTTFTINWMAEG
jgi:hypothetical protein